MLDRNILIMGLDDDPDMQFLIKERFSKEEELSNCEFVDSESEFFEKFNDDTGVALIDHYLNGEARGFSVVHKIRELVKRSQNRKIGCKIIIISGQKNYEVFKRYVRMGITDYFDKDEDKFFDILVEAALTGVHTAKMYINYFSKWKYTDDEVIDHTVENQR